HREPGWLWRNHSFSKLPFAILAPRGCLKHNTRRFQPTFLQLRSRSPVDRFTSRSFHVIRYGRIFSFVLGMVLAAAGMASAADSKGAITDPKEAGADFVVQGEYTGTDTEGHKWGCHVIALGDGKFDVVGYVGGLPGDGWKRG